ncbi:MAG: hypothetical protein ACOCSK_00330 [Rhodothermales bacterium]
MNRPTDDYPAIDRTTATEAEQSSLWPVCRVELDEQKLRMIQDGLYRIQQQHSGGYADRAAALSKRLEFVQSRIEGDAP